jgi:hypothetical protein
MALDPKVTGNGVLVDVWYRIGGTDNAVNRAAFWGTGAGHRRGTSR